MCQCEPLSGALGSLNLARINEARIRLSPHLSASPVHSVPRLSHRLGADVYFKREDQQPVRSFKIRGALNKMLALREQGYRRPLVCASAGNHAQGFAFSCGLLNNQGVVFLPKNTPKQKVDQVRFFGKSQVSVRIEGNNFDDCFTLALQYAADHQYTFVHPFDDVDVVSGQGTLGVEMLSQFRRRLDVVFLPIGGGGLFAGVAVALKALSPATVLVGVEVEGSQSMAYSLQRGRRSTLPGVDSFADGTAVALPGQLGFEACERFLDEHVVLSRREVVEAIYQMNDEYGVVVEPAGAMAVAAAQQFRLAKGVSAVCVVSGGNNSAARFREYQAILCEEG